MDVLEQHNMVGSKPVQTPLSTSSMLQLFDGSLPVNGTLYRQAIGSLQYLLISHPDIAFAVYKLFQFMHAPNTQCWSAVKRLLRDLNGTRSYGLLFLSNCSLSLHGFCDANWVGNTDDRTSTGVYIIFLGTNPIS